MWFGQIKHCSSQPDQRERPDTAGDRRFVALVGFLEGEAEKKGQCQQQRQPLGVRWAALSFVSCQSLRARQHTDAVAPVLLQVTRHLGTQSEYETAGS